MPSATEEINNETKDATTSTTSEQPAGNELTAAIDDLLQQIQTRFSTLSDEMLSKMDEMSRRLDGLESQLRTAAAENANANASGPPSRVVSAARDSLDKASSQGDDASGFNVR